MGLAGNDSLYGEGGNDTLVGDGTSALGSDLLQGDADTDTADYGGYGVGITADIDGTGDDGVSGVEADNITTNTENITGGGGADNLTGSSSNNTLRGNGGNDTIVGGTGSDSLRACP